MAALCSRRWPSKGHQAKAQSKAMLFLLGGTHISEGTARTQVIVPSLPPISTPAPMAFSAGSRRIQPATDCSPRVVCSRRWASPKPPPLESSPATFPPFAARWATWSSPIRSPAPSPGSPQRSQHQHKDIHHDEMVTSGPPMASPTANSTSSWRSSMPTSPLACDVGPSLLK